jgi:hypothetical protein
VRCSVLAGALCCVGWCVVLRLLVCGAALVRALFLKPSPRAALLSNHR